MKLRRPQAGPEFGVIQAPELLRRLTTFLGLRTAHVAPTLAENVQPVIVLGDLSERAADDRRAWGGATLVAGAATVCNFELVAAAETKTFVEKLIFSSSLNDTLYVAVYDIVFAGPTVGTRRWRDSTNQSSGGQLAFPRNSFFGRNTDGIVNAATAEAFHFNVLANQLFSLDVDVTLYPGQILAVSNVTFMASVSIGMLWREGPLSPGTTP